MDYIGIVKKAHNAKKIEAENKRLHRDLDWEYARNKKIMRILERKYNDFAVMDRQGSWGLWSCAAISEIFYKILREIMEK